MIQYPKTQNLHRRDERGRIPSDPSERVLVMPEAAAISAWQAHEKIDGTNCRLDFRLDKDGFLATEFNGRTDNAQLHKGVHDVLSRTVDHAAPVMQKQLLDFGVNSITVFAEAIGPKIQGNLYHLTAHQLVAFDVLVNDKVWLPQDAVDECAKLLDIERAPRWNMRWSITAVDHTAPAEAWLNSWVRQGFFSALNPKTAAEGLILRPLSELRTQHGERVQIKLKTRDYSR